MELKFTKMHGLGNDFMVIDAITQQVDLDGRQIAWLADRHFGVGFDQLLLVESPTRGDADFDYRIFNADGGEVEQCGNGARCFVRFVRDHGMTDKDRIRVNTRSGVLTLELMPDGQVQVDMGIPDFSPASLPFDTDAMQDSYCLQVNDTVIEIGAVSMGNPHAILLVDNVDEAPVTSLGPALESHPAFASGVNVGFMQILDPASIRLRVFERGAGETLACGSGACAAVAVGQRRGMLHDRVSVALAGGVLVIQRSSTDNILMTGPATRVYDGVINIDPVLATPPA